MYRLIKLCTIKIPLNFLAHPPKRIKVEMFKSEYKANGCFKKDIIVDKKYLLLDGYARLCALKELGIDEYKVKIHTVDVYVYAHHKDSDKEFVWVMPRWAKTVPLKGDIILVDTKCGVQRVIVDRVEYLEEPPSKDKIKKVLKW